MYKASIVYLSIAISAGLISCSGDNLDNQTTEYEGPILEQNDMESLYSDSSVVRLKLMAPKQLVFLNKDREFPNGLYLEFYEADGSKSATLESNYCYYYSVEDRWRALGNVVLKGLKNDEQLNTEELYWDPIKEIVYTDKFVRVETEGRILMGEGLEAKQDFSWWKIDKGKGDIYLDEENP